MSSLSRLSQTNRYTARISNFFDGNLPFSNNKNNSLSRKSSSSENTQNQPKIQFRKILFSRNNHNRLDQKQIKSPIKLLDTNINNKKQEQTDKQSNISYGSQKSKNQAKKAKQIVSKLQKDILSKNQSQKSSRKYTGIKPQNKQKRISSSRLSSKISHQYRLSDNVNKITFQKASRQNLDFLKDQINCKLKEKVEKDRVSSGRLSNKSNSNLKVQNKIRPLSSSSSSLSLNLSVKKHRQDKVIDQNNMTTQSKFSFFKSNTKRQSKIISLQQIINQFDQTQYRINDLIQQKWNIIELRLLNRNVDTHNFPTKNKKQMKQQIKDIKCLKHSSNNKQKYSFSHAIYEKNIDIEIMYLIKKLRMINLNQFKLDEHFDSNQNEVQAIKQELENRRSKIVQKALAQSMVQGQLLRKYFSGLNANGLSTSNYKVGQIHDKNKLIPTNIKSQKLENIKIGKKQLKKQPQPRQSVTKSTQNQQSYKSPQKQDYQKYRYKHPNFKPNLQPLPKSAYQSEFFSYGNVINFDLCKEQSNSIFPKTYALRNSSYRDEYKQINSNNGNNRFNYKQLDAYHDKYRQPNFQYFPKKRSLSQTNNSRGMNKKGKNNKYTSSIQYIKKLKTQMKEREDKSAKQFIKKISKMNLEKVKTAAFLTQSRRQYENPQKLVNHMGKSQIKHKNLYNLKYELKKKFHA